MENNCRRHPILTSVLHVLLCVHAHTYMNTPEEVKEEEKEEEEEKRSKKKREEAEEGV